MGFFLLFVFGLVIDILWVLVPGITLLRSLPLLWYLFCEERGVFENYDYYYSYFAQN